MRIVVFGNSGSGKSTYAKKQAEIDGSPHLDLDTIAWEPGQIAVPRLPADADASLRAFMGTHASWVIEGCYGDLIGAAASYCEKLIFLNPGREACLANNLARPWEPHKYASIAAQNAMLDDLQRWVAGYYERADDCSYRRHRNIFDSHVGPKREYVEAPDFSARSGSIGK
jgi:adenylate kinase family enzyme